MPLVPKDYLNKNKKEEEKIKKNENSFNVTNPDDQAFFEKARKSGLSDSQIAIALTKKKQLINEGVDVGTVYSPEGEIVSTGDDQTQEIDTSPFKGYSKQEVLRMAFQSGITKKSHLQEISDTYDLVMGTGEKDKEIIKQEDFAKAEQFITDNPDASKEELTVAIRRYTNLDATDINALIGSAGAVSRADIGDLTDEDMRTIAREAVKTNTGLFTDKAKGKSTAISEVESAEDLTRAQKDRIIELLNEEYPEGRSLLSRILPGGK